MLTLHGHTRHLASPTRTRTSQPGPSRSNHSQIVTVSGVQDDVATKDAVAMGVGMVLFWPALFFLAAGDDKQAELANLKGQYEALESAAIQKNCTIAPELLAAKAQREELKKQQEAKQREAAITP